MNINKFLQLKTLLLLFAVAVITLGYIPVRVVQADDCSKLEAQINALDQQAAGTGTKVNPLEGLPRTCTINALSYQVIKIFFYIAGGVAVVFIMIGGFQYMVGMSTGGDEAISKAKKTITFALVGLVIIMLAGTMVIMLYNLVTNNSKGLTPGGGTGTGPGPSGGGIDNPGNGTNTDPITYTLTKPYPDGDAPTIYHYDISIAASTDQIKAFCGTNTAQAEVSINGELKDTQTLAGSAQFNVTALVPNGTDPSSLPVIVKVCKKTINEE